MKKRQFILLFTLTFIFMLSCSTTEEPDPNPIMVPDPVPTPVFSLPEVSDVGYVATDSMYNDWKLLFEENFSDDLEQWNIWSAGAYNNELQLYREANLFVENDFLYIHSKRANVTGRSTPFDAALKNFKYVSGRIETKKTFGPRNVDGLKTIRISARLRLVAGDGLWPAFWSYNDPWPTKGELDILEARGNTPNEFQSNFHYGMNPSELQTSASFNEFKYEHTSSLAEAFHLYEIIWSRDSFEILFDGQIIKTYDLEKYTFVDDFFEKKHRVVLNLAVGGGFFSNLDETKIPKEAFLVVDWVKVHSKK